MCFKRLLFVIPVSIALLFACLPAQAGEMDILVNILVEKGVLNEAEAQQIRQEVKQKAREEREQIVQETAEQIKKDRVLIAEALPTWIRNTRFKGDFRLRYEYGSRSGSSDRNRARYRLRLGFVTEINEKVDVGFGLDSGGEDPRSTNQSMGDSFESPDIRLDHAYASYRPTNWMTLTGGKFYNPLWHPSDMLWDSDIRPEGLSVVIKGAPRSGVDLFMTASYWILDEYKDSSQDPAMVVLQPGYKLDLGTALYLKQVVSYYNFINEKGTVFDYSSETNTLDSNGNLRYEYDAIGTSVEFGIKRPFDGVQLLSFYGEYIDNIKVSSDDKGFMVGAKIGHKKIKNLNDWQLKAEWQRLERDAWLDIFPNADAYGGETDIQGFIGSMKYGLMKNVFMALSYFHMEHITGKSLAEDKFQADLNFNF